jgi:probable phosphoglycerate mutase
MTKPLNESRIYFLRHGETDWNSKLKLLQGHTDIPLNEQGHEQCRRLPQILKDKGIQRAISSDLTRAQQTASYVQLPLTLDSRLREIHLGVAEGQSWDQLEKVHPPGFRQLWSQNTNDNLDLRFHGGESRREVTQRVLSSIEEHLKFYPNESLLFVSHGFVIRSLVYHCTDIQIPFFVPNCALVPFRWRSEQLIYEGPASPEELEKPNF